MRLMKRHGLAAIINLRGENGDLSWYRYEKRVCAALGAPHLDAMLDSRKLPTRPMLVCLMQAFDEARGRSCSNAPADRIAPRWRRRCI